VAQSYPWLPPALTKPRFRLYVAGHTVSVLGSWIQHVALSWLVFRLTGSVFILGLAGFLLQIPYLLLGPIAGGVVDRRARAQLLIAIDIALAALATLLALLAFAAISDVRVYLAVAALIGIANAFETPARQSLFKDIVEEHALLASAIAVSSMVFNLGRMLGPALAGLMLLYMPESLCFALNALSYGAIIAALLAMKLPPASFLDSAGVPREGLKASTAFLFRLSAVRYLLPAIATIGLFATPYVQLMPSIVAHFFDGRPSTLGLLMGAAGFGALSAATYLSLQTGYDTQLRLVTVAPAAAGLALLAFAWSRNLVLSFVLMAAMGAAIMCTTASTNALLQQSAPEGWRGRVIGLYITAFSGSAPLGNLIAGSIAEKIGLTATLTLNGALIFALGLLTRWRLKTRTVALRGLIRSLHHSPPPRS
jgi:MFS family permease